MVINMQKWWFKNASWYSSQWWMTKLIRLELQSFLLTFSVSLLLNDMQMPKELLTKAGWITRSSVCVKIDDNINELISMALYPTHPVHDYGTDITGWLQYWCDYKQIKLTIYEYSLSPSQWWGTKLIRPYFWGLPLTFVWVQKNIDQNLWH